MTLALISLAAIACSSSAPSTGREPAVGSPIEPVQAPTEVAADTQLALLPSTTAVAPPIPAVSVQTELDGAADSSSPTRRDKRSAQAVDRSSMPNYAPPGVKFVQLLPRDGIPPIYSPTIRASDEVTELTPKELVLGVSVNGQSRAYPIGPLDSREMVNDELGGVPILVTW